MPAKTDGQNFKGSWSEIWMLGTENGFEWPKQHPPLIPLHVNADLSRDPLIAGLEWNVQEEDLILLGGSVGLTRFPNHGKMKTQRNL